MHTLQIVADGTPGGGTTNVLALSEDLLEMGHRVSFCCQRGSYAMQSAARLGAGTGAGIDFFRGRLATQPVLDVDAMVSELRPDVVHVHGGRAGLAFVRRAAAKFSGATVYTVRGYHFLRKGVVMRRLAANAERFISHRIDRTVHVCHYDQQLADRWRFLRQPSSSAVIHNGIRLADIPFTSDQVDRRHVAVLGRLTRQKTRLLVLRIAALLRDDGFVVHLIGGGHMQERLQSRKSVPGSRNDQLNGAPLRRAKCSRTCCIDHLR